MALTSEEKQILELAIQKGKSKQQAMAAIAKYRESIGNTPGTNKKQNIASGAEGGFFATLRDIPSDIGEVFTGVKEDIGRGIETAEEAREQVTGGIGPGQSRGEISPLAGTVKTIGGGLRAGASAIGRGLLGAGKLFTSPAREEKIAGGVQEIAEDVIETDTAQKAIKRYQELSPENQAMVDGLLGTAEGFTTMFGVGPATRALRTGVSTTARAGGRGVAATARGTAQLTEEMLTKLKGTKVAGALPKSVKDIRRALSDIDPQVETMLRKSTPDDVNRYFVAANNAKKDITKSTPFEIVGKQTNDAFDLIDEAKKKAFTGKNKALDAVSDQKVPVGIVDDVTGISNQRLGEAFGVEILPDGKVTTLAGRGSVLDAKDVKLLESYFNKFGKLTDDATVRELDDFVDWAQSQLYKQSKTLSKLEVASDPVIAQLRGITGEINGRLKTAVGGGYGEINARIVKLLELQDEISRALGADARRGAGTVKNLFSPTGSNTRRIFQEVLDETGIDLFKEATLAKFAMESVGDVRQASLLKSLDIAIKSGADLDLTKPVSVIKWLRERADLDGQELANELMKKFSAESSL